MLKPLFIRLRAGRRGNLHRTRCGRHSGKDGGEARAFADFAFRPHAPAVTLDEAPDDRQPKAGAAEFARWAAVDLVEALEDFILVLGRNADAGVLDGNSVALGIQLRLEGGL